MFAESVHESWRLRYGSISPADLESVAPFLAHRSVRRYSDEPIRDETIALLVGAAQSAATSSNLQSWSVISVQDPERRQALSVASGHQKQVLTAPLFLVFLADLHRILEFAKVHGMEPDGLDTAEMYTVGVIDASLAAERLVCAAEAMGYGICYIGGLRNHPDQVRDLLNLPPHTFGVFGLCVGRPAENARADIKPRLGQEQVWFKETYPEQLSSEDYDRRMNEFFAEQGMDATHSWSEKSSQRVHKTGLSGRESLLEHLRQQGLLKH